MRRSRSASAANKSKRSWHSRLGSVGELGRTKLGAMAAALFLRHREPGIADFAEAVQLPLEFRVFPLDHFPVGVRGNINRPSNQDDRERKWQGQLKMIPGFLKCAGSLQPDIKGDNRTSGAARQHDGSGFGDEARTARPVYRKGHVETFLQTLLHHREAPQAAPS